MISNNLIIIGKHNINLKKKKFKLEKKIKINNDNNHISYSNYLPKDNKIIYSFRKKTPVTNYKKEETYICDISNNDLINHKLLFKINNISHNFSIKKIDNEYVGIGGVYGLPNTCQNCENQFGIKIVKLKDLSLLNNDTKFTDVISYKLNFQKKYKTAFDSNISILKYNNKYYIYTRYNENKGIRKTQIFISDYIEKNYKYYNIVKFNENNIFTYTQNIFIENNIFIGIFRYYSNKNKNKKHIHNLYQNKEIGILISHSFDGINFIIDNKKIFDDFDIKDILVNNYKEENNFNYFFTNNLSKNIFSKYKIRKGGYISFEQEDNNKESQLIVEIKNNLKSILLNYKILDNGFCNLIFKNLNNELLEEKKLKGDYTDFILNLPKNTSTIEINCRNTEIYQIL